MKILKFLKSKIKNYIYPPKPALPFFTKEIFKKRKYQIGEYTYGYPTILFENDQSNLIIGKFCSIASGVTIFLGGNHRTDWITTYPFSVLDDYFPEAKNIKGHPATKGNVVIGNDVWIGTNVIIMSGVSIGNGAVIAAGSVVSKNIEDYEIWGGNPARLLKKRFDTDAIIKLQKLQWWNWEISKIKENTAILCSQNIYLL